MARRLLFVSQQLPWPKDSGGNIRTHAMLAALAREFQVVLCSTSDGSASARQGVAEFEALGVDVRLAPDTKQHGGGGQVAGVLRSLLRGLPAVLGHTENPPPGALAHAALREGADPPPPQHTDHPAPAHPTQLGPTARRLTPHSTAPPPAPHPHTPAPPPSAPLNAPRFCTWQSTAKLRASSAAISAERDNSATKNRTKSRTRRRRPVATAMASIYVVNLACADTYI